MNWAVVRICDRFVAMPNECVTAHPGVVADWMEWDAAENLAAAMNDAESEWAQMEETDGEPPPMDNFS